MVKLAKLGVLFVASSLLFLFETRLIHCTQGLGLKSYSLFVGVLMLPTHAVVHFWHQSHTYHIVGFRVVRRSCV